MDEVRLLVNEELMDALTARVDDLERRLEALVGLLRRDTVSKAMGLNALEFDRANANDLTLQMRPLKHFNERRRRVEERRQKEVLTRLTQMSPERLDELCRGRS